MKKIYIYCIGMIVLILATVLIVNGIKGNDIDLKKEMEITKNYSKSIILDYNELGLDEEIDNEKLSIVSENEDIATVDKNKRTIIGNNPGKTAMNVYYNDKLIEKINVKINDEKKEDDIEEINVKIESNGNKEEKNIKVINGVLQEKLCLKKDDTITIIRQYKEERITNDYMNKIMDTKELQFMEVGSREIEGEKMTISIFKVLEDVEI